jgi:hypothetical protein
MPNKKVDPQKPIKAKPPYWATKMPSKNSMAPKKKK